MLFRKASILIVEDDPAQRLLLDRALGTNYLVTTADSVQSGLLALRQGDFDLFILDIMLPDGDSFEILKFIRSRDKLRHAPVIFLTGKEDLNTRIKGFALGADDYILKPCDPLELQARVEAKVRRLGEKSVDPVIVSSGLKLDLTRGLVTLEEGGRPVQLDLSPIEFRLLLFLVQNPHQPLTRSNILKRVWGEETHVLERSVDSYVALLRKKLGEKGRSIRSVHGLGYRFVPMTNSQKAS